MINLSQAIYRGLKRAGIDFAVSVPCVNLDQLLELICQDDEIYHLPVTREEEGVGICAGAWMGGRNPVLLMQNSGLGNSINALASLNLLYGIPLLIIISQRGGLGETIVGQVPMGTLTPRLIEVMEVPSFTPPPVKAEETVDKAWNLAISRGKPVAVLLGVQFWRHQ
jgi:sulfopyruvate decarboxylase subunit alpha